MLGTLSLALWLIGFYLVLKYRVHIHVNITNSGDRRVKAGRNSRYSDRAEAGLCDVRPVVRREARDTVSVLVGSGQSADIASALANLGYPKAKASEVAKRVCSQPGSFDELLRAAIREAA